MIIWWSHMYIQSLTDSAVYQAALLEKTFSSTATETTQSGASNCAEGSCLLCEGRFSPGELYRMFFWSRQGKQQQLCTSSWGGMYLCVRTCAWACVYSKCWPASLCEPVCLQWVWSWRSGPHWKLSPGNYTAVSSIHKKRREKKSYWQTEWSPKWLRGKRSKEWQKIIHITHKESWGSAVRLELSPQRVQKKQKKDLFSHALGSKFNWLIVKP